MHVLRESLKLTSSQPSGYIIVEASVCGLQGYSEQATSSSANKHGAIGFVQCAAKEAGRPRIRIDCVAPGMIDTSLAREGVADEFMHSFCSQLHISRPADASGIVRVMPFLAQDSSFVTRSFYTVGGV